MLLLLLACNGAGEPPTKDPMWPFPSAHLIVDGRVSIAEGAIPAADTPVPVERFAWRSGFSIAQTALIDPGVALDPATLPGPDDVGTLGSVQLWDLDDGRAIRCFAELDAHPDQEIPLLIVRPLEPMTAGHRIAVAVTTDALDTSGAPMPSPDWYAALLAGEEVADLTGGGAGEGDADWGARYQDLAAELSELGAGELVLAFDFPVSDARAPLQAMVESVSLPTAWELDPVDDEDLPDQTSLQLSGTFTTDDWLVDDGAFDADAQGVPALQGQTEAALFIHVPESVQDAEPGTVPVWLFGHGIFSRPEDYLAEPDDPSGVVDLADRAGAILIGTTWRGLTTTDLIVPVTVGGDPGRFPELTDKLAQGVANNVALSRLILEGGLLDDPALMGLPDDSALWYYGISLGGIEGSVLLAADDRIEHGVLHVPGSTWSTMLERSSNWTLFEPLVMDNLDDPRDRQLLYAASQLFWDPVEPAAWVDGLADRSILIQEAIGDEQVPNMTTDALARGVGATQLEPMVYAIEGLESAPAPLNGPAIVQFDSMLGLPAETNRPAESSGAHDAPRGWLGAKLQTARFLDPDDPGVVEHFCGGGPCAADNDGSR